MLFVFIFATHNLIIENLLTGEENSTLFKNLSHEKKRTVSTHLLPDIHLRL